MHKNKYKSPNISEDGHVNPPKYTQARDGIQMMQELEDQVIASVVKAEIHPENTDNRLAKKYKKEKIENEKRQGN